MTSSRKLMVLALANLVMVACAIDATIACTKKTGATPTASAAITADAIVIRVNELQAAVIQACGPAPACAPNTISTITARDLVQLCIDLRTTLKAVPAGWPATVKAAWTQAKPRLVSVTDPVIVAAIAGVDILIGGL